MTNCAKMVSYLPKCEIYFYISIYMFALVFGVHQVYLVGDEISTNGVYSGFTTGWRILQLKRDDLDYEWETWKNFTLQHCLWFVGHVFLSEFVRLIAPKKVPYAHALIGIAFIYCQFPTIILLLFAAKLLTFYVATKFGKIFVWMVATFWVFLMNYLKTEQIQDSITTYLDISDSNCYEIIMISAWNILKLLSCSLDCVHRRTSINATPGHPFNVINVLGYVFYFPTMFVGPIIIYNRYSNMLEANENAMRPKNEAIIARVTALIVNLLRLGFWLAFNDFALHFIYVSNLTYNPQILRAINPWALYTFGYIMGQFFYNKYVVAYGLGCALASFDRINTPGLPKCVGRIHLYSDMWKYFDQGLYEFLFIYIYKSICTRTSSTLRKVFGSFITFIFIYLWHGFYTFVLIWAILNFVCVQAEKLGKVVAKTAAYNSYFGHWSEFGRNRLAAFFGSQLFIPAAMSNFFFIGGYDVGMIYIERIYFTEGIIHYIILSFSAYCIYNTGEYVWRCERKKAAEQIKAN